MNAKKKQKAFAQKGIVRREYSSFSRLAEKTELDCLDEYDACQREVLVQYATGLRDFLASSFIESFTIDEQFLTSTWTALSDKKQNGLLVEYIRVCEFLQFYEPRKSKEKPSETSGDESWTVGDSARPASS